MAGRFGFASCSTLLTGERSAQPRDVCSSKTSAVAVVDDRCTECATASRRLVVADAEFRLVPVVSSRRKGFFLTMIQSTLNHRGRDERAPGSNKNPGRPVDRTDVVADAVGAAAVVVDAAAAVGVAVDDGSPSGVVILPEACELQVCYREDDNW